MTHQVPDYELTPSSVEFAADPQNHAIYCEFSKDHLHETKCDCDLAVALIEIEQAAVARVLTVERLAEQLHFQLDHGYDSGDDHMTCFSCPVTAKAIVDSLTGASHDR